MLCSELAEASNRIHTSKTDPLITGTTSDRNYRRTHLKIPLRVAFEVANQNFVFPSINQFPLKDLKVLYLTSTLYF